MTRTIHGLRAVALVALALLGSPRSGARAGEDDRRGVEVAHFACDVDRATEPLEAEVMAIAEYSLAMRMEWRSGLVLTDRGRLMGGLIEALSNDLVAAADTWREVDGAAQALLVFDRERMVLSVVWIPAEGLPPRLVLYDCEPFVEG